MVKVFLNSFVFQQQCRFLEIKKEIFPSEKYMFNGTKFNFRSYQVLIKLESKREIKQSFFVATFIGLKREGKEKHTARVAKTFYAR